MTNSVEQRPSSKADSFSTCREIPRTLWNPESSLPRPKQPTHQSSPLSLPQSHFLIIHFFFIYFSHPRLVLPSILLPFSSHSRLGLPSGLRPSGLLARTHHAPLSPTRAILVGRCAPGWWQRRKPSVSIVHVSAFYYNSGPNAEIKFGTLPTRCNEQPM